MDQDLKSFILLLSQSRALFLSHHWIDPTQVQRTTVNKLKTKKVTAVNTPSRFGSVEDTTSNIRVCCFHINLIAPAVQNSLLHCSCSSSALWLPQSTFNPKKITKKNCLLVCYYCHLNFLSHNSPKFRAQYLIRNCTSK